MMFVTSLLVAADVTSSCVICFKRLVLAVVSFVLGAFLLLTAVVLSVYSLYSLICCVAEFVALVVVALLLSSCGCCCSSCGCWCCSTVVVVVFPKIRNGCRFGELEKGRGGCRVHGWVSTQLG
jgi:hypothetical protein